MAISSHFNLSKKSKAFNIDLESFLPGEYHDRSKVFRTDVSGSDPTTCAVAVSSVGEGANPFPQEVKGMVINEDVSSLIFLHACALPAGNQKAYYNIPDFFDTADLLGWYEVVYEDGFRSIVPVRYGVNILEWNPGSEGSLDTQEGKTGSPQNAYCYRADPVLCSSSGAATPVTFHAFEWVNPRFGKKIAEVNLYGSVNYQRTVRSGNPRTEPMPANAIILAGISKVTKRTPFKPEK